MAGVELLVTESWESGRARSEGSTDASAMLRRDPTMKRRVRKRFIGKYYREGKRSRILKQCTPLHDTKKPPARTGAACSKDSNR